MGRGRRAKVRKVESKKPQILKEYDPVKQTVMQNMIVYNANLGDQNMLLRAVTNDDLKGDLTYDGQVRVPTNHTSKKVLIVILLKVVDTLDKITDNTDCLSKPPEHWIASLPEKVRLKLKVKAKTIHCQLSNAPVIDLQLLREFDLIKDDKIDLQKVRETVQNLESQLSS